MTRTTTRAIIASGAIMALSIAVVGCSPGAPADNGRLTVFAPQGNDGTLADNTFTKEMAEKFDIDFDWQTTTYDGSVAGEKRQISLASGDYPDAYLLVPWVDAFSQAEVMKYGQQGLLMPLEDLIDEYAPNIKQRFEEEPRWKASMTAPDGHIYAMTQWSDCFHCSFPSKLWINTEWLKNLNLAMPTTTEELRTVLRAFKDDDPNGNGLKDEVPLSGSAPEPIITYFMDAFTYVPPSGPGRPGPLVLDDGKVAFGAVSDEWRDGLSYLNSLAAEGLLDTAAFSQNAEALKALGDNANGEILGAAVAMHPYVFVSNNAPDGRDRKYDAVPPLKGPDGAQFATWQQPGSTKGIFAATNKSTEEERIKMIKLIDYMVTDEGDKRAAFGPEGEAWVPAEPGDVALDPELTATFKPLPYEGSQNSAWRSMAQYWDSLEWRNSQVVPEDAYDPSGYERRLLVATKLYEPFQPSADVTFPVDSLWPDLDTTGELADLQTNITNYLNSADAEFVTGQRDIADDKVWAAFKSDLDGLGLPRYLELWQAMYDAQSK